jgi:hypothetical protein
MKESSALFHFVWVGKSVRDREKERKRNYSKSLCCIHLASYDVHNMLIPGLFLTVTLNWQTHSSTLSLSHPLSLSLPLSCLP